MIPSPVDCFDAVPYDAAIVLGAMVRPDGSPSPALARRVAHGVRLVQGGTARNLLMSGGPVRHPVPEARVMRDLALGAGLRPDQVHEEDASVNTIGNAMACGPVARARGWSRLLLVTDACHMPRAFYTFRRLGLAARPSPVWPPGLPGWEWYLAWGREVLALPWTVIRVERLILQERRACP